MVLAVVMDWPYQMVPWIYMASLWQSDIRAERDVMLVRTASPHSDAGFNASVQYALDKGAHEILSVSCDQSIPKDCLARWRKIARDYNADVVGALYATRQPGHAWLIWDYDDEGFRCAEPKEPVQRVGAIGGGCLFIKRKVFEKVPRPWFSTTVADDGFTLLHTNEYNFFMKCREHGIRVFADNERISDHQYEVLLNAQTLGRQTPRLEVLHTTKEQQRIMDEREKSERKLAASGFRGW